MSDSLCDKICLVTGATRGIGKAIAMRLAAAGATVIGTATSQAGADTISSYLAVSSAKGEGVVLNVNDESAIQGVSKSIVAQYGDIAILVNNAGITRDNLLLRMKVEQWDEIIQTNLKSIFLLSKICLRGMTRAKFGRIINIASVVGVTGNAGQVNYAAAKAGVIGFSKSLAQEVASRNITVNAIAPGFISTDMTDALNEAQVNTMLARIPMARLGEPEDIAEAAYYLASDMAAYVTGTTLHVNGGMYMN